MKKPKTGRRQMPFEKVPEGHHVYINEDDEFSAFVRTSDSPETTLWADTIVWTDLSEKLIPFTVRARLKNGKVVKRKIRINVQYSSALNDWVLMPGAHDLIDIVKRQLLAEQ